MEKYKYFISKTIVELDIDGSVSTSSIEGVGSFITFEDAMIAARALCEQATYVDLGIPNRITGFSVSICDSLTATGLTFATRHTPKYIKALRGHGPVYVGRIFGTEL